MKDRFVTSRLDARARTTIPKAVREALDIRPADQIGYTIRPGRVVLSAVKKPRLQHNPFACFEEWASEADIKGYASL